MARIKGIDLPKNKRGVIGLTYIYGIGPSFSVSIWMKQIFLMILKCKIGQMSKQMRSDQLLEIDLLLRES